MLPANVKLIAVSKLHTVDEIYTAYKAGQKIFGENKAQELSSKYPELPEDIEWHFIGHLQTNKVKYIAPFVSCIHSVDSYKLLMEINKYAKKNNSVINCLLQFYIATEESKFGFTLSEAVSLLNMPEYKELNNVKICGVMGMASFTDDNDLIRSEFKELKNIFDILKLDFFNENEAFKEISMGMSQDYQIAIEEGSTMVRIGTAIFGERNY